MGKSKKNLSEECSESIVNDKIKIYPTFKSMKLKPELLKGIANHGFVDPSPIQQKAIMPIVDGDDVIIQAQSGSGKTATFCIGVLQALDFSPSPTTSKPITQALILAPTRELAQQICKVFDSLSDFMSAKGTACYGGTSGKEVGDLTKKLRAGQHVVVGTPGRVLDMIKHGHLATDALSVLVLDEADEMMAQGLDRQLEAIYRGIAQAIQVVVVSATLPKACLALAGRFQTDPVRILVRAERLSVKTLSQFYIAVVGEENKFSALADIYANNSVHQTIIFVNTRQKVDWLATKMRADGFTVSSVHGQVDQAERERLMQQFRSLETRVLICTDVWARGIDVHTVNLVVNYDLPVDRNNRKFINKEVYLHRVGRSGRFERKGVAVSLVTKKERDALTELAKHFSITIKPAPRNLEILTSELNQ